MDREAIFTRLGAGAAILAGLGVLVAVLLPRHAHPRWAANETAAIAALRTLLATQNQFQRTDFPGSHRGSATLAELARLGFIDKATAEATSPDRAKAGYYFCQIPGDKATGPFDFSIDFGLCAVPARYPRTGRNTFVIDVTGVVYQKDTGGKPVTRWPDVGDVSEGWIPFGSE